MVIEVRVPEDVWPTRSWSGRVVAVHVSPGDCVGRGDAIIEVEVEKAVLEIASPSQGRVLKVLVSEGDMVKPGTLVAVLEEGC